jgi:hypothetical protein
MKWNTEFQGYQEVHLVIPLLLCIDFARVLSKFKAKLPYVVRRHIPSEAVEYTFSGVMPSPESCRVPEATAEAAGFS